MIPDQLPPTSSPLPIAVAVVERAGQFLIGQRPADAVLPGLWEFPGGKIEQGETPQEAARRECLEETDLAVIVGGELSTRVEPYDHGSVELHFFTCVPVDPHQTPKPPFCWVAREELSRYDFPEGNRELLRQLKTAR